MQQSPFDTRNAASQHRLADALALEQAVPRGGYRWWYIDGISDDGQHSLTLIAFIGSVFSPYYALARRRGGADPHNHVALNVGLYGALGHRWAMTERGRRRLAVARESVAIGPSRLWCDGEALVVDLDEVTAPLPARIRGSVTILPAAITTRRYPLDVAGRHYWQPIAACARIEVRLERPRLHWVGHGYVDSNAGAEPIEDAFESWQWSRATLADGSTAVLYDIVRRDLSRYELALRLAPDGSAEDFSAPAETALPSSGWRVARSTRSEPGITARVEATLEDGPFYARSLVRSGLCGASVVSVHESLSLRRFRAGWVQTLLPFRMPRRA